jgi:hypothetical protein
MDGLWTKSAMGEMAMTVASLPTEPAYENEVDWYFSLAEGEMGLVSNYEQSIGRDPTDRTSTSAETRAEAAHRAGKIRDRLRALTKWDAGVLQVAYETKPVPENLKTEFGTLTSLMVRLACAEVGLPDDDFAFRDLERTVALELGEHLRRRGARCQSLRKLKVEAQALLDKALAAYAKVRTREQRKAKSKPPSRATGTEMTRDKKPMTQSRQSTPRSN